MAIKGLDSFLDVFEIIKDPAKYEAKIKEIQDVTKQYKEATEAVVALASVNDYVLSIKEREQSSKKALEDAKAEATDIVAKAKEEARAIKEKAKEAKEQADYIRAKMESMQEAAQRDHSSLQKDIADLANQRAIFKAAQEEFALEKAALKEKQDKLAAALK